MAITKEQAVAWARSKVGQRIDFDGVYGAQCMDLVVQFCVDNFGWRPTGNAIDLTKQGLPGGWQRIKNTPSFLPLPGDIFIWAHDQYGHTGIMTSANMNSYTAVEQNAEAPYNGTGPAKEFTRNYTNFWGVLRPPYAASNQTSQSGNVVKIDALARDTQTAWVPAIQQKYAGILLATRVRGEDNDKIVIEGIPLIYVDQVYNILRTGHYKIPNKQLNSDRNSGRIIIFGLAKDTQVAWVPKIQKDLSGYLLANDVNGNIAGTIEIKNIPTAAAATTIRKALEKDFKIPTHQIK